MSLGEAQQFEERSPFRQGWDGLRRPQTEEGGEMVRYAEELDGDRLVGWCTGIAHQAFCPGESNVCPLRPRQGQRRRGVTALVGRVRQRPDLKALLTHQLQTGPSMRSSAPVSPEQRLSTDRQWMEHETDLARLVGGAALPLALGAQPTRTARVEAGPIDDAQAAIGFSALFMGDKQLVSRASQRPIRLEREGLA